MCLLCDENIKTCSNCYWGQVENNIAPDACGKCNYSAGAPSNWSKLDDNYCRKCGRNLKDNVPYNASEIPRAFWKQYSVDTVEHPYHCSNCGWSNYHIPSRYILDFKRCPECGAIMDAKIREIEERTR